MYDGRMHRTWRVCSEGRQVRPDLSRPLQVDWRATGRAGRRRLLWVSTRSLCGLLKFLTTCVLTSDGDVDYVCVLVVAARSRAFYGSVYYRRALCLSLSLFPLSKTCGRVRTNELTNVSHELELETGKLADSCCRRSSTGETM